MNIIDYIKNPAIIAALVFIINLVKKSVDQYRRKRTLPKINKKVWWFVAGGAGILAAVIAQGISGFEDLNVWALVEQSFIYGAGAVFAHEGTKK